MTQAAVNDSAHCLPSACPSPLPVPPSCCACPAAACSPCAGAPKACWVGPPCCCWTAWSQAHRRPAYWPAQMRKSSELFRDLDRKKQAEDFQMYCRHQESVFSNLSSLPSWWAGICCSTAVTSCPALARRPGLLSCLRVEVGGTLFCSPGYYMVIYNNGAVSLCCVIIAVSTWFTFHHRLEL